ncbi:MAG: PAS domain-containing protein, partial [Thiomicrospira sp.]|nr:PAS domain-containing protein [Thiomicrospira sp.]
MHHTKLEVTSQGRILIPSDYVLTSRTDLFGTIVDASDDFAEVCGYKADELIGQPHNIIRHPDVPKEAFRDLWSTLKGGGSWQCIVKNRARDGHYYWVVANASPIKNDQGEVVEYLSVRTPATDEQIAIAEKLYALLNAGDVCLEGGIPITRTQQRFRKLNPFKNFKNLSFRYKSYIMLGLFILPMLLVVLLSLQYIERQVREIWFDDIAKGIELAARTELRYTDPKMRQTLMLAQNTPEFRELSKKVMKNKNDLETKAKLVSYLYEVFSGGAFGRNELSGLAIRVFDPQFNLLAQGVKKANWTPAEGLHQEFKQRALARTGAERMTPLSFLYEQEDQAVYSMIMPFGGLRVVGYLELMIDPAHNLKQVENILGLPLKINYINGDEYYLSESWLETSGNNSPYVYPVTRVLQGDDAKPILVLTLKQDMNEFISALRTTEYLVALVFGFVVLIIVMLVYWAATRLMKLVSGMMTTMERASLGHFDQRIISPISEDEFGHMIVAFNNLMNSSQYALVSVTRSLRALSSGDTQTRVDYRFEGDLARLKQVTNDSLEKIEVTFQSIIKGFMGLKSGEFSQPFELDTRVGGAFKSMLVQMDDVRHTLNGVVNSLKVSSQKMAEGDFSYRISENLQGDLESLKTDYNKSIEALEAALNDITQVVVAQSDGDLTRDVSAHYLGELGVLKEAVNATAQKLVSVVSGAVETSNVVSSAAHEVSSGSLSLSQRVQEQAAALEQTSATMDEMNAAVQANTENAQQTAHVAQKVQTQSQEGVAVMQQTIAAMNAIQESSHKIAEIVTLIDGIAFQTNLLALNAAVEAA